MDNPKPHPDPKDYHEGPEAAQRFVGAVRRVLSVSPTELRKRHQAWEKARKSQRQKPR